MSDSTAEFKETKGPEIIRLKQEFLPFDPKHTTRKDRELEGYTFPSFERIIKLQVNDTDQPIHMTLYTQTVEDDVIPAECFDPFNPEKGYRVDSSDLTATTRASKLDQVRKNKSQGSSDFSTFWSCLTGDDFKTQAEVEKWLKDVGAERLMLQLSFPNGLAYVAPADLSFSGLNFVYFYPLETGRLPEAEVGGQPQYGHEILLPEDPKLLTQVKAMFFQTKERFDIGQGQLPNVDNP